jgi:hypothetical protein
MSYDCEGTEHRNIRYFAQKLIYIAVLCTFIVALIWCSTNIVVLCTFIVALTWCSKKYCGALHLKQIDTLQTFNSVICSNNRKFWMSNVSIIPLILCKSKFFIDIDENYLFLCSQNSKR